MRIALSIKNMGHTPSFKNAKRVVFNRQTKKPFLATKREVKEWMTKCIQSFDSQLFCMYQTGNAETRMALNQLLPTASWPLSIDFDDSVDWIPEMMVVVERVPKGKEGADIIIEPLKEIL